MSALEKKASAVKVDAARASAEARLASMLFGIRRKQEAKLLRDQLSEEQGHRCCYCGVRCTYGATLDHITPKSRGGQTVYENCVMACELCNNTRKTNDAFSYFKARQAALPAARRAVNA